MGVISTNKAAIPAVVVHNDEIFPIDYLIESPESTDVEEDEVDDKDVQAIINVYGTPRRNRSAKFGKLRLPRVKHYGPSIRQQPGARKLRRAENAKMLLTMIDADDICEDLSDTLPETISAFTQLFLESSKMTAWNDFVQKSEEEQQRFLKRRKSSVVDIHRKRRGVSAVKSKSESEKDGETSKNSQTDKRELHPAFFSGGACYRRVDKNLKMFLSHKHAPLEKLNDYETELTKFFNSTPDGVWIESLSSGYERLLLHAVSQYLGLRCQSFDTGDEQRQTQVDNLRNCFTAPRETLADFLSKRKKS